MTTDDRTRAIQQLWTDGDFPRLAERFAPAAQQLVDDLNLAGRTVLDAGTGTGNAALAAARAGAEVSAFDLTPVLLAHAQKRAEEAQVAIEFREGDLLDIPWPDDSFDVVLSVFAAFLADDPARCLTELVRVCRPGGRVVTTAWSEQSIFLRMMRLAHTHDPDIVRLADPGPFADRERLAELADELPVTRIEVDKHPPAACLPVGRRRNDAVRRDLRARPTPRRRLRRPLATTTGRHRRRLATDPNTR